MIFDIQLFSSFQSLEKLGLFGKISVHFLIHFPALALCCEQHSLWSSNSRLHLWQRVSVHFCTCFYLSFLLHVAYRSYHFISFCSESALGFIISSIVSLFSILPIYVFLFNFIAFTTAGFIQLRV